MRRTPTCTLAVVSLAALALASPRARADDGLYATALAGLTRQGDTTLAFSGVGAPQSRPVSLDGGLAAGGALGWASGTGWRIEGEFLYQSVDAGTPGFAPPGPQGAGDNFASTAFGLNVLYDVDLLGSARAKTYIGLGYARLTEVDIDIGPASYSGDGDGWQLLFGARYDLGERAFLDAGVRYLDAGTVVLDAEAGSGRIEADYAPWAVTVGLGWRF